MNASTKTLGACLLALPGICFAITGNELNAVMNNPALVAQGQGYIRGVLDGFQLGALSTGMQATVDATGKKQDDASFNLWRRTPGCFDFPNGVSFEQIFQIVTKSLKDHPETRDADARGLVINAVSTVYPCAPTKP